MSVGMTILPEKTKNLVYSFRFHGIVKTVLLAGKCTAVFTSLL